MLDLQLYRISQNVDDKTFKEDTFNKRIDLINIAIMWRGEIELNEYIFNNVWEYPSDNSYKVSLAKFGKEYYQAGDTGNNQKNCNDMKPTVLKNQEVVESIRGRFDDIFALMELCKREGKEDVLKAFATLFYRNSLLFDHSIQNGNYTYTPPQSLVDFICTSIPEYEGVPMEVYIHFLDAIGLNEDVKYFTKGILQNKTGAGRENNMKTYSYNAACVLGLEQWSVFIYKLMRGYGVAPIANKDMAELFPELEIEFKEPTRRERASRTENIIIKEEIDHF